MSALPPLDLTDPTTTVTRVVTQHPPGLLGVPLERVRLSWQVRSSDPAARQRGYQVSWGAPAAEPMVADAVSGPDQVGVPAPGEGTPTVAVKVTA